MRCSLCKHKDPSSIPRTHVKNEVRHLQCLLLILGEWSGGRGAACPWVQQQQEQGYSQVLCCKPDISVTQKWRLEDRKFKASLGNRPVSGLAPRQSTGLTHGSLWVPPNAATEKMAIVRVSEPCVSTQTELGRLSAAAKASFPLRIRSLMFGV